MYARKLGEDRWSIILNLQVEEYEVIEGEAKKKILQLAYTLSDQKYPTRNRNPTFPVTHFPVMDINSGWAHILALWHLELCRGDFLPGVWTSAAEW
jgi:hypothetical protein